MKRWWVPTQKGTEMWPRTTIMPPKLIIEGVETGTPLYRALAGRYAGRLKQFHGKAQQAYSLSPNEVAKSRIEWHDGKAVYMNIQGQEIIQLFVYEPVILEELGKPENVPDFAVVDFRCPLNTHRTIAFTAALLTPQVDRTTYTATLIPGLSESPYFGSVVPINGIEISITGVGLVAAREDYSEKIDRTKIGLPLIELADPAHADGGILAPVSTLDIGQDRLTSLKVDFRTMPKDAMVVVDIYGHVYPDSGTNYHHDLVGYRSTTGSVPIEDPGPINDPDNPDDVNPAAIVDSYTYARYAALLGGSPTPNPGYVFNGAGPLTASELSDAVTAMYGPAAGNTPHGFHWVDYDTSNEMDEFVDVQLFGNPTGSIFGTANGDSGPADEPYASMGYDQRETYTVYIAQITRHYPYEPVYNDYTTSDDIPALIPCDLSYAFYEPGTQFITASLSSFQAIWGLQEGEFPSRSNFSQFTLDSTRSPVELYGLATTLTQTADNPYGLPMYGRLILARKQRAVAFKATT